MKRALIMVISLLLILGTNSFISFASHEGKYVGIDFENFTGDYTINSSGIATPNDLIYIENAEANKSYIGAETTDRGRSARMISMSTSSKSGLRFRNMQNFISTGIVFYEVSLKFSDKNLQRNIGFVREYDGSISNRVYLLAFNTNGSISLNSQLAGQGTQIGTFETGIWYDIRIGYDYTNKIYTVTISDGQNIIEKTGSSNLDSTKAANAQYIWINQEGKPSSGSAETLVDDIRMYTSDSLYRRENYNFNDFTDTTGVSKPTGFTTANTDSNSVIRSAETDKGNSVNMVVSTNQNPDLRRKLTFPFKNTYTIKASFKADDLNTFRRILIRDQITNSGAAAIEAVKFSSDGSVTLFGSTIPNLTYTTDEWYDIEFTHNINAKYAEVIIRDNLNAYRHTYSYSNANISVLDQVYLASGPSVDNSASCYWDDLSIYERDDIYQTNKFETGFNDFVGSLDGQLAPTGMVLANTSSGNTGVWGFAENDGKAAKMYSNGVHNFELRKNFITPLTGKYIFETEIKMIDNNVPQRRLGLKSSEKDSSFFYPIIFSSDDNKIIIDDKTVGEFETGKWYYIRVTFNTSDGTYDVQVMDSNELCASGSGAHTLADIAWYGVGVSQLPDAQSGDRTKSLTFIDSIKISSGGIFDLRSVTPSIGSKDVEPDSKISLTFTNSIDRSSLETAIITLNGEKLSANDITISDGNVMIISKVLASNKRYDLLFRGIKDILGNELSDYVYFVTGTKELMIGDVEFYKEENGEEIKIYDIMPGRIIAKIKISAQTNTKKEMDMFLAMYDMYDGDLVSLSLEHISINGNNAEKDIEISVPSEGKYQIKSFLWDKMQPIKNAYIIY